MIVSRSAQVLFVHVQKCGGSSVEAVLLDRLPGAEKVYGLPGNRHATLAAALAAHPEWAGFWTFGFVRNPWARLWSWYAMIRRRGDAAAAGNAAVAAEIGRNRFWAGVLRDLPTFEAFVLDGPARFTRLGTPQVDYLRVGSRHADLVGRTEHLDHDLGDVFAHLGVSAPAAVRRVNAGPAAGSTSYRDHYTPALRDRVAETFAADLEAYGYTF